DAPSWLRYCCDPRPSIARQRKHRELATKRSVVTEASIATDRTEARLRIGKTRSKTDAGPATDARQDGDVLLAAMFVRRHVADDAGRGFELVKLLACLGIYRFEIAFERAVEHDAARGG